MTSSQKKAVETYRNRLTEKGLARFEVVGRDADRDLIRALAKRLAEGGKEAAHLRKTVQSSMTGTSPTRGAILEALRRSPLVGADLDLKRPRAPGRKVSL
ncbi:MAG: hypothetical protein HYU58_12020 [Proteobacteria bacterium]|nr:hypothetical protein [Pseudomonadota bacterium]